MNVDTLNSKYKVVSKYFIGKTVMDESLTDFKEKKSFKVLNNNKAPAAKPKVKKVKRVKGQKDIRSVFKSKKNELVAYSKDFDTVCKKSGIDVDSEQLQLAIALSKSLQTTESTDSPSSSSKSLTAQQRSGLIRTTLKEYGFKVPEKPNTNRKTKKRRKPYKLLLTSDKEKQQIITDKYSQLLFELNKFKIKTDNQDLVKPNLFVYNMSTNVEYENIKEDSIFFVENLVEETPNSMGCLLKNWSDIPGRPLSPELEKSELLFSEIECSQSEMDIVLSGTLKYSKDILIKKNLFKDKGKIVNCCIEKNIDKAPTDSSQVLIEECIDNKPSSVVLTVSSDNMNNSERSKNSAIVVIDVEKKNILAVTQPSRSLSPDLFDDDDDDTVVEIPNEKIADSVIKPVYNVTKEVSEVMNLTECVNIISQKIHDHSRDMKSLSQLSQQVNITKRKSNDFMEMTECVGGTSQPILETIEEQIDLTGHCEDLAIMEKNNSTETVEMKEYESSPVMQKIGDHVDLTEYCENIIEAEKISICDKVVIKKSTADFLVAKTDDHIDLTGQYEDNMEKENNSQNADNIEHMDLTQSSNSSNDTLPIVHISGKQTVQEKSLDQTIILNENDYLEIKSPKHHKQYVKPKSNTDNIDIATNSPKDISVSTVSEETPIINLDDTSVEPPIDDEIDLTQTSDSNEASGNVFNNISHQINNSSLGKKDDVSVDYDEALENMNSFPYYSYDANAGNSTELMETHTPNTNDDQILSNRKQSVLEISDNESNSPRTTINVENHFDFGGDNLTSFKRKSRNSVSSIPNGSMSDSLPIVNVKGKASPEKHKSPLGGIHDPLLEPINHQNVINENSNNTGPQTPQTKFNAHPNVETPEQSEYIVKTDNVTPMLDYASMTTPERNKELDKYGLKPFKRKRAIQLLTHLYNQTHPYVESTEELTSPSKKRKKEDIRQLSPSKPSSTSSQRNKSKSPRKKSRSPRKHSKSPRNVAGDGNLNDSDKENELFMVTSEVPAIRNVECDVDDWVFQKREKAKLHSCRVPLHVAFHNYVSCRRHLHEAILRYEPINIDIIHKELAASGHRYDPKDLLKFMDKKCITVKTVENVKNNRRF